MPNVLDFLHYGVGRPDGANTMIKTISYLAEADPARVLVALDLKAAFQNHSRRAMLFSIEQNNADLAAVFSKWYTGTTEHRMHHDSAYTNISANSGVDQGCPLSTSSFSAAIDPVLRSVSRHHDPGAKLFACLDDCWYVWIKPQYLPLTFVSLLQPPDQSTFNSSPPRFRSGKPLVRCQLHLNYKTRSDSHSAVLEPSPNPRRHRAQPCCSGRAGLHGQNNTTLPENRHHPCRPQC